MNIEKDELGNIVISNDFFIKLLNEFPKEYTSDLINQCHSVLGTPRETASSIIYGLKSNGILLERYHSDQMFNWSDDDVNIINEVLKVGNVDKYEDAIGLTNALSNSKLSVTRLSDPEGNGIAISDDGVTHRPWNLSEIDILRDIFK